MRRNIISEAQIDEIAKLEADSIIACLRDPDLSRDPKILNHARRFLKDHAIEAAPTDLKRVYAVAPPALPMFEEDE